MNTTITGNGDHLLNLPQDQDVTHYGTSIIRILENIDTATVLVGESVDGSINFSPPSLMGILLQKVCQLITAKGPN